MLKKGMFCVLCFLLLFQTGLPAFADVGAASLYMYVETGNTGRLHLRARPDSGSDSLGLYSNGTLVQLEGLIGDAWAAVLVNGRHGYMNMNYLTGSLAAQSAGTGNVLRYTCTDNRLERQTAVRQQVAGASAASLKRMYVSTGCGSLHLRAYASQNAQSLGLYPNGAPVYAADLGNGWSYVLAGGLYGCMMTQYLSPNPPYAGYSYSPAPTANLYVPQYSVPAQQNQFCNPQPTPVPLVCGGPYVTVQNPNSSFVYLRSSKDSDRRDNILAQVPVGTRLILLEYGQYWSRVNCAGTEGYMATRYLN